MLTTEALTRAVNALHYPTRSPEFPTPEALAKGREAYRAETKRLEREWQAWLADEYAPSGLTEDQAKKIFEKAWEDGHAHGYSEVENYYISLTDFLAAYLEA